MPSAMSSPSEPVEIASTSILESLAPSRMIEPLPKFLSIWARAASSAFCLSMFPPSTTRSGGFCMCVPLFHELQMEAKRDSAIDHNVHGLFSFDKARKCQRNRHVENAQPRWPRGRRVRRIQASKMGSALRALPPGDEGQALEEMHVLLVLEEGAVQR